MQTENSHTHTHFQIFLKAGATLLTYMDIFNSVTHTLSFSASVFVVVWRHYSSLRSLLLCPETFRWIKAQFLQGRLQVSAEKTLSLSPPFLLPLSLSPLLFQIRVNEMVPFTHPIWARPWNTPCFVKRWRGMTCDLQKPPDNYLFTYLCIDCWH